jgi:hypothetical protein
MDAGADVQATDRNGFQPLQLACYHGHLSPVRRLLAAGANVNHHTHAGFTGVLHAVSLGFKDILECLAEHGADIEYADTNGDTPILKAVTLNKHECLEYLLTIGANYLAANALGKTILHVAAEWGDVPTLQLLAAAQLQGLEIDAKTHEGKTAMLAVVERTSVFDPLRIAFSELLRSIEATNRAEGIEKCVLGGSRNHVEDQSRSECSSDENDIYFDAIE